MADLRYLPRHVDDALARALGASPVVVLDGPRAVGKTTSAGRLAASSVLLPRDLEHIRFDPAAYLAALPAPVLVDEWQLGGIDLLWTIKAIVDADPTPGRFLLTGSVEPASYGPTYPLTGRSVRLVMRPMTVAESEGRGQEPTLLDRVVAGELPGAGSRVPEFEMSRLARSGFPAALDMADPGLFNDAYAAQVSQRAGQEGRDATRLLRTMRVLATLTGQATPDQRIWDAADINKGTWKAYDDLLTRVHLATPSPAFESNRLARVTSYPKRFLADTALALALAEVRPEELTATPSLAGRFFESFVAQQLRPQVDRLSGSLMHLRTGAGEREIDAVVETGRALIGVAVKLGRRPTAEDARALDWLRERLGERFTRGFIIHAGGDCYPLGDRIDAVPFGLLVT